MSNQRTPRTGGLPGAGDYADILYRDRPISKKHKPMSMENRAAQFAPFAALTGFEESIKETGQLAEQRIAERERGVEDVEDI